MPRISQQTLDEVNNVSVVELAHALGDPLKRVGSSYNVPCPNPNHSERTPDTYIKGNTNIWKCFGGSGCGAKGSNAITYYSWHEFGDYIPKQHFVDSVIGIAELMGIEVIYENGTSKQKTNAYQPRKQKSLKFKTIEAAEPEHCDKVYRRFLELCPIYKEHAEEWLGKKRQYTKEDVLNIGLRSAPKTKSELETIIQTLLDEGYSLERVPGFTKRVKYKGNPNNEDDWFWFVTSNVGYYIPVRDHLGRIIRLRVATGKKPKYIWFSSDPTVFQDEYGKHQFFDPLMAKKPHEHIYHMRKGGAPSGAPINELLVL